MREQQLQVREFHKMIGRRRPSIPHIPKQEEWSAQLKLIVEEVYELIKAFEENNLINVADGLADVQYVILGMAEICGINLEKIFAEVHRSNMTKAGGHFDSAGKWIKPPTYTPPNLSPILKEMSNE